MLHYPSFITPFPLWLAAAVISIAVTLLYGPFLHNPLVFDDHNFFTGAPHPRYAQLSALLDLVPRWMPYASLEWTGLLFGDELFWYRLGNLLLHIAVAVMLFIFLRALFSAISGEEKPDKGARRQRSDFLPAGWRFSARCCLRCTRWPSMALPI